MGRSSGGMIGVRRAGEGEGEGGTFEEGKVHLGGGESELLTGGAVGGGADRDLAGRRTAGEDDGNVGGGRRWSARRRRGVRERRLLGIWPGCGGGCAGRGRRRPSGGLRGARRWSFGASLEALALHQVVDQAEDGGRQGENQGGRADETAGGSRERGGPRRSRGGRSRRGGTGSPERRRRPGPPP